MLNKSHHLFICAYDLCNSNFVLNKMIKTSSSCICEYHGKYYFLYFAYTSTISRGETEKKQKYLPAVGTIKKLLFVGTDTKHTLKIKLKTNYFVNMFFNNCSSVTIVDTMSDTIFPESCGTSVVWAIVGDGAEK